MNPRELPFWGCLSKPKLLLSFLLLFLLLLSIISSSNRRFFPPFSYSHSSSPSSSFGFPSACDFTKGEWVRDPDAPRYTNTSCFAIQEHQNCMKYGRPDTEFLKWRWRPAACELPPLDPARFLETVRGRSMAFVGDSLARNHMQSLLCLLSKVERPKDISKTSDDYFKQMLYSTYNFTVAVFWSRFLVNAEESDPDGPTHTGLWNLYLDELDDAWASQIGLFDYIVLSAGNWFTRPTVFFERRRLVGCHYCLLPDVTDLTQRYSQRMAFRTVLRSLAAGHDGFRGTVYMRTLSPTHFENGTWNDGGDCVRTRPLASGEARLEGLQREFYEAQLEEFRAAEKMTARGKGVRMRLLDTTAAMLVRADGHPSRYGHWANENVTMYNDCVHWCLPGPIDIWNDFLFAMLQGEQFFSGPRRRRTS